MADRPSRKRAVNLSVDSDLLDEARRLGINLSEASEQGLRLALKAAQEKRWLEENQAAIADYNARVVEYGLLSDEAGLL